MADATDALLAALADPATYPDGPETVERRETHASWVFLAGDRALKVKKPVVLPFLDYGTLERRRAMCREEVRINRRLATDVYLGTVGLVPRPGGGVRIDADDEAPGTVEVGVLMRRFADGVTLAARVAAGTATPDAVARVGARLAAFHAAHPRPTDTPAAVASLRHAIRTTLDDLEAASDVLDPEKVRSLRGRLEAVLAARRPELLDRGGHGLVVDGHGDLRAEHVLLTEPPQAVDALEFDPALRIADVSADLAFLTMDLEAAGAPELAEALVDGYRAGGGDPGDPRLLAAMGCYRALVRAKVDLVRARQDAMRAAGRARARVAQAVRLAWRAIGPLALAVCGPPASGKSTLAAALAGESGMVHLSSDVVRKTRMGLAPTERAPAGAYDRAHTLATYRALGEHAAAALAAGRGAVIDATLGDAEARWALRQGLGPAASELRYVECKVPADLALRRVWRRESDPHRTSDADIAVARRLAATWAPLDEVTPERHLPLRADRPVRDLVADLWAWLDRHAPDSASAPPRRPAA